MAKSFVGHPYVGQLTKDEKIVVANMLKSMVKPRNILLMLKEYNANSYTTIKQIYNAKNAYRSSIRGSNSEMQKIHNNLHPKKYIFTILINISFKYNKKNHNNSQTTNLHQETSRSKKI